MPNVSRFAALVAAPLLALPGAAHAAPAAVKSIEHVAQNSAVVRTVSEDVAAGMPGNWIRCHNSGTGRTTYVDAYAVQGPRPRVTYGAPVASEAQEAINDCLRFEGFDPVVQGAVTTSQSTRRGLPRTVTRTVSAGTVGDSPYAASARATVIPGEMTRVNYKIGDGYALRRASIQPNAAVGIEDVEALYVPGKTSEQDVVAFRYSETTSAPGTDPFASIKLPPAKTVSQVHDAVVNGDGSLADWRVAGRTNNELFKGRETGVLTAVG